VVRLDVEAGRGVEVGRGEDGDEQGHDVVVVVQLHDEVEDELGGVLARTHDAAGLAVDTGAVEVGRGRSSMARFGARLDGQQQGEAGGGAARWSTERRRGRGGGERFCWGRRWRRLGMEQGRARLLLYRGVG